MVLGVLHRAWMIRATIGGDDFQAAISSTSSASPQPFQASVIASDAVASGDLVFFFESLPSQAVTGWGQVAGTTPTADRTSGAVAGVHVLHLEDPKLASSPVQVEGLFSEAELRAVDAGRALALSRQQVQHLSSALDGDRRPPLENILEPENAAALPTLPLKWMARLASDLHLDRVSHSVEEILSRAAQPAPRKIGRISTSRILLGCLSYAATFRTERSANGERELGLFQLGQALRSDRTLREAAERLRSRYLSETRDSAASVRRVQTTENAAAMLRRANEIATEVFHHDALTADALLACVLSPQDGRVATRAATDGIPTARLQKLLLVNIARDVPGEVETWQRAFDYVTTPTPSSALAPPQPAPVDATSASPTPAGALALSHVLVASHGNDDPWQHGLKDSLGVEDEARAFARLAASKALTPPLAVGVFGEWGSGKSFFLKLVSEHIERLESRSAREASEGKFHADIVQIRFNAWHYVDTNLWASLVNHVFVELDGWVRRKTEPSGADRFFETLSTARELTLDAAELLIERRQEQARAASALGHAEKALRNATEAARSTPAAFWAGVTKLFREELKLKPEIEAGLKSVGQQLGLPRIVEDAEAFKEALHSVDEQAARSGVFLRGLLAQTATWPVLGVFAIAAIAIPVCLSLMRGALLLNMHWPLLATVEPAVLATGGVLAAIGAAFRYASERVSQAMARLNTFKSALDAAVLKKTQEQHGEVKSAEVQLTKLGVAVEAARAQLVATNERLADAAREFASGTGRARLLQFVRERATSGDYSKHLGLVATIRRDFEELSERLNSDDPVDARNKAASDRAFQERVELLKAKAAGTPDFELLAKLDEGLLAEHAKRDIGFDRIVLYIDDLDRCTPDKVVDVLQAVHLLLTFRLFVVFVAVDVRWAMQSLEQYYSGMRSPDVDLADGSARATAHDYLEKIFQIPYWVRPMTPAGSEKFLEDRYQRGLAAVYETDPGDASEPAPRGTPGSVAPPIPSSDLSGASSSVTLAAAIDVPVLRRTEQPVPDQAVEPETVPAKAMLLSAAELAYMKKLSAHVGDSPRRALRFLNVYLVIKSSLPETAFESSSRSGFMTLMTQVAIVTGAPALSRSWMIFLENDQVTPADVEAFVARMPRANRVLRRPEAGRLLALMTILSASHEVAGVDELRAFGRLASRYSFWGFQSVGRERSARRLS